MFRLHWVFWGLLLSGSPALADEMHDHGVPEKLGSVSFAVSCVPAAQQPFNRAVALLHSFAFAPAEQAFRQVAEIDPKCAMAHWGLAMVRFHPVWTPPLPPPEGMAQARDELNKATQLNAKSQRERDFIRAAGALFQAGDALTTGQRTLAYEQAMAQVAHDSSKDVEAQVFYALALLSNASPNDKTHAKQKQAIGILQPLFASHPDHPGLAHYLIHACDSEELAKQGLPAARVYARIAPSAPHALHMPSHIFTRLGLWDDSIRSNLASRQAAHAQGDAMGELHAMDYLVYAYLQEGKDAEATRVIEDARAMHDLDMSNNAIAYAATVMPIRAAVERGRWNDAAQATAPAGVATAMAAIAVWSKGLGLARSGHPQEAREALSRLRDMESQLRGTGDDYDAVQTSVLADEVAAWVSQAEGKPQEAERQLRAAADREDAVEKRPVTPGAALPAREQLGDLLLQQNQPAAARDAFQAALAQAPGRRGAVLGKARAEEGMR